MAHWRSLIPGQSMSSVGGCGECEGTTRDWLVYRNARVLSDEFGRLNLMWSL